MNRRKQLNNNNWNGSKMKMISEFIKSGMIETYVLGLATLAEKKEVEEMAVDHAEIRIAINEFSETFEQHVLSNAVVPDPIIKPMVLATINYISRMEKGEPVTFPPLLHADSQIKDFEEWLTREDMLAPSEQEDVYARIIGNTSKVTTAIIWIKNMAPAEVHTNELEKFLIVEGTCEIIIEEDVYQLAPGDFLSIPLYKSHSVKVTSVKPCKVILQRCAA